MSAWERALQGRGGGNAAVVAARNRDARRRQAEARAAVSRSEEKPFVPPTAGLGASFRPTNEDYASAGRMSAQVGKETLFGPERESWITEGQASLPERFARDWFTAEQERNLAAQSAREGNTKAAVGWGALGLAGILPIGRIARGVRTAGNVAESAADISRTMPSGPPPTPPISPPPGPRALTQPEFLTGPPTPPAPTRRKLPGWDDPVPARPTGPPPTPPTGPTAASVQRHNQRVTEGIFARRQERADRLNALRELQGALETSPAPALPLRSSLSRANPLGDLRITSGTPEVTTGTRTTLRDFALPYEELVEPSARELAESTAAPFLDAGLLVRRGLRQNEIDRAADLFARTGDGRTIRDVPRLEVDRARRIARELAEDYRGRFFESPNRLSVRGANPNLDLPSGAVPFRNLAVDWNYLTYPNIDQLVYGDYVDELAGALGRAPLRREFVDVQALNQLLEAINSGQVSSVLHPKGLQGLLDEGAVPNVFDTRATSAGANPSSAEIAERMNLRRVSESSLLGVPYDALGSARPRYGYVEAPEGYSLPRSNEGFMNYSGVADYGPIVADWSNDVRNRASYTVGDSLNQIVSGSGYAAIPRPLANTTLQDLVLSGAPYAKSNRLPYVETQLFDGPTIDDLVGLRVAPQYFDETSRLLQRRGIDVPVDVLPEPRLGFPWEVRGNVLPFR